MAFENWHFIFNLVQKSTVAVALEDLDDYINDFTSLMEKHNQSVVYYAHAGAGELHLRPILNIKKKEDVKKFKKITDEVAALVKSYQGSMSGEHGDGIVRGAYVEFMLGSKNYQILKNIKAAFDPNKIFNPGKIIDSYPMDEAMRYTFDRKEPEIVTLFDFSDSMGILRAAEKCNGSGDCRKSVEAGGTMCPSYRATKDEKDSTRGRANVFREILSDSEKANRFDHEELKEVLDLCLSCKGCTSECPSNVDMSTLKAEFEYQYQKVHGTPLRSKMIANNYKWNQRARKMKGLSNFFLKNPLTSSLIKSTLNLAPERSLPLLSPTSLRDWCKQNLESLQPKQVVKEVILFIDEFTDQLDSEIGIESIQLLSQLGYKVNIVNHVESGRAHISKGLLVEAQKLANQNIELFSDLVSEKKPLIGIEPSAILSFRDEYPRLAKNPTQAKKLAAHCYLIDEFIADEINLGNIQSDSFTKDKQSIILHGHCHQKALSSIQSSYTLLDLPTNYQVQVIPSGCCGMAGSFGYEKEHYALSLQIAEHSLLPAVRKASNDTLIAAPGTSCRHQIKDGANRTALHPVSILYKALVKS